MKCNGKKKYEYIFSLLYIFSQCKLFQSLMLLNAIHSTNHSFIQSFIHPIIQSFNLLSNRVFLHYMQLPPFLPHPHPSPPPPHLSLINKQEAQRQELARQRDSMRSKGPSQHRKYWNGRGRGVSNKPIHQPINKNR